jgi:hypothetical protein
MPCRGTGQVISTLGGTESRVSCPWCGGTAVRVPGRDAQATWLKERGDAEPAEAEPAASSAEPPA